MRFSINMMNLKLKLSIRLSRIKKCNYKSIIFLLHIFALLFHVIIFIAIKKRQIFHKTNIYPIKYIQRALFPLHLRSAMLRAGRIIQDKDTVILRQRWWKPKSRLLLNYVTSSTLTRRATRFPNCFNSPNYATIA